MANDTHPRPDEPPATPGVIRARSRRRFGSIAALAAAVLGAAVYLNTVGFGAAWDDTRFVFQSGASGGVAAVPELLASPFLRDVAPPFSPYRPVTGASYAVDWSLGGGEASFFHWTNVALHGAVTAAVTALLGLLGAPAAAALAGGAVFAVHPVHVEAVANLAGRADLLATLFCVLSVVAWLVGKGRAAPAQAAMGAGWTAAVAACWALALGAKESAVVLPALLAVAEWVRPGRRRALVAAWLAEWRTWGALAAVGAAYMGARRAVLGTFTTRDVAPFVAALPEVERVTTAVANQREHLRLLLWPRDLSVDYGPAVLLPAGPGDPVFWAGVAAAVAAVALVLATRRRVPLVAAGVLWGAAALLPVSNLVVPIAKWLAERFLYLPSVGLSMAVAGAAAWTLARGGPVLRRGGALVLAAALVSAALRTWTRNRTWESNETVVATLLADHPEASRAQWWLGQDLLERGRAEEGFRALRRALDANPNAMALHLELASWRLRYGRPALAESGLLELPPLSHPEREAHLARAQAAQGRTDQARATLSRALERFPGSPALRELADSLGRAPGGG